MILSWAAVSCSGPLPIAQRPAAWAKPIDAPGLPNLHQVDASLYRGGQPTPEGLQQLHAMGIKTVINARSEGSAPDPVCSGQVYCTIPMSPWSVSDEQVIAFLRIAVDPMCTPVFIHCHNGSDRTGVLCAMYRIIVQGWTRQQAIDEMTRNGMGFHDIFQDLIDYINACDVDRIRAGAGIAPPRS